ncbi:MAG TPA: nuclear transport factor 2 family protein [Cyclobacteriaceae bacterium]|nr:nuclear transport factor 2 family protein [Cyclobacteriaceae bacterium]
MKNITPLIILLALGMIASCNREHKNDDPEVLKKILSDYFDGIKNKDINKMNAVTTTDFILFEDGKVWNNDSLLNLANTFNSFQGTWTFDFIRVTIDKLSGDIVYLNHGDFIINDTIEMKFDWVESATFSKVDGSWKMNLLHSTVKK